MRGNSYKRILIGILFPAFIVIGCWCTMNKTLALPCYFRELTDLYCPGCGSGRAIGAILMGNFREAFRWNPMVFLLGIPSMGILAYEYIRFVFDVRSMKPVMLPVWVIRGTAAILIAFWILRNIPALSFLAPCLG